MGEQIQIKSQKFFEKVKTNLNNTSPVLQNEEVK